MSREGTGMALQDTNGQDSWHEYPEKMLMS